MGITVWSGPAFGHRLLVGGDDGDGDVGCGGGGAVADCEWQGAGVAAEGTEVFARALIEQLEIDAGGGSLPHIEAGVVQIAERCAQRIVGVGIDDGNFAQFDGVGRAIEFFGEVEVVLRLCNGHRRVDADAEADCFGFEPLAVRHCPRQQPTLNLCGGAGQSAGVVVKGQARRQGAGQRIAEGAPAAGGLRQGQAETGSADGVCLLAVVERSVGKGRGCVHLQIEDQGGGVGGGVVAVAVGDLVGEAGGAEGGGAAGEGAVVGVEGEAGHWRCEAVGEQAVAAAGCWQLQRLRRQILGEVLRGYAAL